MECVCLRSRRSGGVHGLLVPAAVTVRQPEITDCNLTAPIATLGAHRHSQELLLHPNCTQILTALARDIDIVIRRKPKSPHVAGRGNRKSKNYVFGRRNENAGAAGLSPDTMSNAVRLGPVVVAWAQLLVADHQLAVKQMQLFNSSMAVRRIIGSPREPYQHADAVFFGICCELFAGDSRRHFFPFRSTR